MKTSTSTTLSPRTLSGDVIFLSIIITLLVSGGTGLFAQTTDSQKKVISGIVLDEKSEPLPGANVYVKETKFGTVAAPDGTFEIQAVTGDILVFSFIGYENREIVVNAELPEELSVKLELFTSITGELIVDTGD